MMKRYLLSIILGILATCNYSFGQIEGMEISYSSENGNVNGTVDVDISITKFINISGLQFTTAWDSTVMRFNSVVSTNSNLPALTEENISGPEGEALDEGQMTLQYNNPVGDGNLPDGAVLVTIRFDLVGDECSSTQIMATDDPLMREAFDVNFIVLEGDDIGTNPGTVMINGADCGGGGDELIITAGTETVAPSENICVPLVVENFINVGAGEGTILWDPSVISYTGIDDVALNGLNSGSLNTTNIDAGELKFVWSSLDGTAPEIANGSTIFSVCFDAVGSVGEMSTVDLSLAGGLPFAWYDNTDEQQLDQVLNDGKVTIAEDQGDPFELIVSDVTVNMDEGTGCVEISVMNFTNIISTQYVLTWDSDIIANATPTSFNLEGLNANLFNVGSNSATLSWSAPTPVSVADGTVIYELCFDLVGDCDETSAVQIVSQGSTNIEIVDQNTNEITNVAITQGSLTIGCPTGCSIVNIDRPCTGALSGNVTVDVPDGCDYSWANSTGTEIATTKNLLGVAAGTYILTVSCNGTETCTLTAEVEAIPQYTINDNVTNAGCGELGSIDISISGGSGNFSYNWDPSQPNSPNISDLNPGPYNLTVTDNGTSCAQTASYVVGTTEDELEILMAEVDDETCNGNDGAIVLTVEGGCQPYSVTWSDSNAETSLNRQGLSAGTYGVTITDDASPMNTVTGSYTVDGAAMLVLVGTANIISSTGNDGSISIIIDGGTEPYNYNWNGPTSGLPNSNSISGLAPGDYDVTVTDASGCTFMDTFNVPEDNGQNEPGVEGVGAENNTNGFAVSCKGDMTGVISGNITSGIAPFTITLSGDEDRAITMDAKGTFTINELAAGIYTVTVSNGNAPDAVTENIEILEPEDRLAANIDTGCDEEDQCDGFIDLNIEGGVGNYTVDWNDPDLSGESADDLCKGDYTVTVEDENGCMLIEAIAVEDCSGPIDPACYLVRNVISPNGDGKNDVFSVTCINDFPATLLVYDRWGKLVYDQDVYDGSWTGISNSNEELIEGGYMYVIDINFGSGNREIMRGTVTILRD